MEVPHKVIWKAGAGDLSRSQDFPVFALNLRWYFNSNI
jgi:hypothetical protein